MGNMVEKRGHKEMLLSLKRPPIITLLYGPPVAAKPKRKYSVSVCCAATGKSDPDSLQRVTLSNTFHTAFRLDSTLWGTISLV